MTRRVSPSAAPGSGANESTGTSVFFGWVVVAAAFCVTLVGFGSAYSFSAFIDALQRDFGASRGAVALVFSLAGFLYFSLGVITGPMADRWGSKPLAITGMVLVAAGLFFSGMANSLPQIYLAYGLGIGLGVGCAYVPAVGAVQRWFLRRRGFASGLAVSGIGIGTLVMPALATLVIETAGWRQAYFVLAGIALVLGVGMAFLLENDPGKRGLGPDGVAAVAVPTGTPPAGIPMAQAIRSRPFIALYLAGLIASFGLFVPFVHLVPYALDHGMSSGQAAFLLGMIGVGSTLGRFFLGGIADRIGRHVSLIGVYLGMALTLVIWTVSDTLWPLALFALTFGAFYGGFVALLPALVMDYFGGRNVSSIIGVLYTCVALGTLIGPTAAGYLYDLTQSYFVAILASIAGNLIAAFIIAAFSKKPEMP